MDPRVARSREKICAATVQQLVEHGFEALTIEGIAAHAGVGKSTIYRHWDSLAVLVSDAVRTTKRGHDIQPTGDLRADVMAFLAHLVDVLGDPDRSAVLHAILAGADRDDELGKLHAEFVMERRRPMVDVLADAVRRGDLPVDLDIGVAIDLLTGPLFLRRFITREPVDLAFAEQLVDTLLPQLANLRRD